MATQLKSDHLYYGIIVLVVLSPLVFFPSLMNLYRLPKIVFISLLVTTLVWLWFFLLIQEKEQGIAFPLTIPMILYLAISVLSLINAPNPHEGVLALSQEAICIFLFWLTVNHVRTRKKIENILFWTVPTAFIVSLVGMHQMFGGDIPGLVNSIAPPGTTFGNKNMAAQYILLTLPFPYMFLLTTMDRQKERLLAICAAVMTTYFLYTGTRAAWVGFVTASLAIFVFVRMKNQLVKSEMANLKAQIYRKRITLGCIALFVLAMNWLPPYFVPDWTVAESPSTLSRLGTGLELDQDISFLNRLAMWANTLEMFKDHPLVGIGKGNLKIVYPLYATKAIKDPGFKPELQVREAHNDYVQLLGETGIFGLLSLCSAIVLIAVRVWDALRQKKDPRRLGVICTLSFSICALLVNAFLDFPFEHPVSTSFFWLFAGLLWASCEQKASSDSDSSSEHTRLSPKLGRAAVGAICCFSLLTAAIYINLLRAEFYGSRGTRWFYEIREGPWQPAERDLKEAIHFNPTTHRYVYTLGLLYIWLGKYDEAIVANLQALRRHPYYINAYNNLGVAYASMGKTREAEWAWRKALDIWPDHNEARNNLATVYVVQGKRREAIALFKESLIRNPQDEDATQKLKKLLGGTQIPG